MSEPSHRDSIHTAYDDYVRELQKYVRNPNAEYAAATLMVLKHYLWKVVQKAMFDNSRTTSVDAMRTYIHMSQYMRYHELAEMPLRTDQYFVAAVAAAYLRGELTPRITDIALRGIHYSSSHAKYHANLLACEHLAYSIQTLQDHSIEHMQRPTNPAECNISQEELRLLAEKKDLYFIKNRELDVSRTALCRNICTNMTPEEGETQSNDDLYQLVASAIARATNLS